MTWALDGQVPGLAAVVARPDDADEVAAVLAVCNDARVPVTAAAGRSGVCGASVPVHGGVVLDLCGLAGIVDVDDDSLVLDVAAGHVRRRRSRTSCAPSTASRSGTGRSRSTLSTVGGWLACRGAGQLSTRYGKIEDMVVGLDVVLADGRTSDDRRRAPCRRRPRPHPALRRLRGHARRHHGRPPARPPGAGRANGAMRGASARSRTASTRAAASSVAARRRRCCGSTTTSRRIAATRPATATCSSCSTRATRRSSTAAMRVVAEECDALAASALDVALVDRWLEHRNDVTRARGADPQGLRRRHDGDRSALA